MKSSRKALVQWGVLICFFVGIWCLYGGHPDDPRSTHTLAVSERIQSLWVPAAGVLALAVALVIFKRVVGAARVHNAAIVAASEHMLADRFDDAERALAGLETSRLPHIPRMFHVMRAAIELARGDARAALTRVEPALSMPRSRLLVGAQLSAERQARALRAFARAIVGDAAGAREDIAWVRAEPEAQAYLLARVSLAEARLLDEAGDTAALGALLERDRFVLLHAAQPRAVSLARAYENMIDASSASVYRTREPRDASDDPATRATAAWVAKIAPNAAPFVRAPPTVVRAGDARAEMPSEEARRKVLATKPQAAREARFGRVAGWLIAILVYLVIFRFAAESAPGLKDPIVVMGLASLGAWFVWKVRRGQLVGREILRAKRQLEIGEAPAKDVATGDASHTQRAEIANVAAEAALRRGDPAGALAACEAGFFALALAGNGKLAPPAPVAEGATPPWDLSRALASQRAFALAALGRSDEAWAEIEWAHGMPSSLPIFRVLLLARLSRRDYEGAARVAEAREAGLLLPSRDEAIAELARFVGRPTARTADGAGRLRAELRHDRTLAPWIEAMAPGLLGAFEVAAVELESKPSS